MENANTSNSSDKKPSYKNKMKEKVIKAKAIAVNIKLSEQTNKKPKP